MQGAEILIKCLEKEDVEIVFGYPGGAILEILEQMEISKSIELILVRHEQGAAHAANGYARAKGKVGVCLATSGPGATNLITGIATAYMDSVPMVIITGQVPTSMVGTDAFQEVDITGISDPITKHNYLVKDAADIPRIIREAFHIASTGRPGPVLIDIPKDVAATCLDYTEHDKVELRGYKPTVRGHVGQIKQVCQLLEESQRPVICAGGGIISGKAEEELVQLAERQQIPVINTLMAIGCIPFDHPLAFGLLGTYGSALPNKIVQESDLFIALGMRFDDRVTGCIAKFAPQAKIIHIDIDAAEIGKNVRVDIPLVGDTKIVIKQLLECLKNKENPEWLQYIKNMKDKIGESLAEKVALPTASVFEALNSHLPEDYIVTTDVGQHQMWAGQLVKIRKTRTFLSSGGLGTMGYGIPAAVGAQVACPNHTVIVVTGDGSFQMGMLELGTALEQGLPLKILLLNNQTLGMVKQLQDHYCGGRYAAVHFKKNPDFQHLALAYGALSLKVDNMEELSEKMAQFIAHQGLAVLEVVTSSEENVYPMVLGGAGLHEMAGWGQGGE